MPVSVVELVLVYHVGQGLIDIILLTMLIILLCK